MKNIIKKYAVGILSLGIISLMVPFSAFAAGVINPDPSPYRTGITSAAVAPVNLIGVSKTANAVPGDIVAVNVYYHNKGDQPINNFKIRMSSPASGASTSFSITGSLSGSGVSTVSDTATVRISSSQKLTFIPGSVQWFPNQSGATGASQRISAAQERDLVGGSGFDIGTLAPGWSSQGGIVAYFQVGDTSGGGGGGDVGVAPNVTTSNYSGYNSAAGNVTINGTFDSNGYATTTSFAYRLVGGSWITVGSTNRGTGSGAFSYPLTGLATGTYEYKALATNAYGNDEGSIFTFTISRNDNTTSCPSGYYWNGSYCVQSVTSCPSGYYLSGNTCIQNITSCPAGYYLSGNTCIQSVTSCPSGYYLSGNTCIQNIVTSSLPTVSTLGTISVGGTAAAVDGYYTANGCDVYTSFRYGTTQSLGNTTGEVNRGNNSGSMAQSISGLAPNTTYYYQAQARNCAGTTTGSIRSFTTASDTTRDTVIIRNTNTTTTTNFGGGGSAFLKLMITNNRETVRGGREIPYEVSWENISGRDLQNLVLEVNMPDQVDIIDTDHGSIKREAHSIIYKIGDLKRNEKGDMTITTEVLSGLRNGDPVVAQAIAAFENPTTKAAENAIAYDADEFSTDGSVLGASIFGLNFLPSSLAGWLLILLILLIIVLIAHSYYVRNRTTHVMVNNGNVPPNVPVDQAPVAGNDYIVYRPTPKN